MCFRHILLLTIVTLLMGACGESVRTYRIGVSQCSTDAWREQMNREMHREAALTSNAAIELDIRSAADNSALQIKQIDSLVASGIDLLVVSPNEARALTSTVESVMRRGIPVIVADRKTTSSHYTAFVGADNQAIGADVGAYVAQELKGRGTVIEFTGTMQSSAAQERHAGFRQALSRTPNVKVIAQVQLGWEGVCAPAKLDSLFRLGLVPQLIVAPNDRAGMRLRHALDSLHHSNIKIVGMDGLTTPGGGLDNVESGALAATFVYPTGGDRIIETALAILQHRPYEREVRLRSALINSTTAHIFRYQLGEVREGQERIERLSTTLNRELSYSAMQNMLLLSFGIIIVLISAVLVLGVRFYHSTVRRGEQLAQQKQQLEQQTLQLKQQRDQLVQMNQQVESTTQLKLNFFTGVSHDFRTPLTLIMGTLEQLLAQNSTLTPEQRQLMLTAQASAQVLERLVKQTLDFRKWEEGQLTLNPHVLNVAERLRAWADAFAPLTTRHMVRLELTGNLFAPDAKPVEAVWDEAKIESAVWNILSNAFKYTPEGGRITLSASLIDEEKENNGHDKGNNGAQPNNGSAPARVVISVTDTGPGIDRDKLPHIFESFYQGDVSHDGSGIGLHTTKVYVELHGGSVKAESKFTVGTRFTITLPLLAQNTAQKSEQLAAYKATAEAFAADVTTPQVSHDDPLLAPTIGKIALNTGDATNNRPVVLFIDDNADMRSYVCTLLSDTYNVACASNGEEGLRMAATLMPEAVVCDVMMPVMDGWECCRRLKCNPDTQHIPVMLLTACTLGEQVLQGFECGADAYMEKPFSSRLFKVQLANLIATRERIKVYLTTDANTTAPAAQAALSTQRASQGINAIGTTRASIRTDAATPTDNTFISRLDAYIASHLGEAELTVEQLADAMHLGRTQLYRKVKSETGLSPVELVRVARLKKAAYLLRHTDLTIQQVAYEVGFATPGYLTKCFRLYFGMNPTDYKAK